MRYRLLLVAVSGAQLAVGLIGRRVAVRDGRPFDIFGWRGQPDRVARDSWLMGTALSPPITMMSVHAVATAILAARPSRRAALVLAVLGATMIGGYLLEADVRTALKSVGRDPVVAKTVGPAVALSGAMAALGFAARR